MGIPAYFRWISEKYPQILVNCVEHASYDETTGAFLQIDASTPNPNGVEFDNLYLDMNGIIHPCTHPEDRPAPTTEAAMFEAVFDYIDRIFAIVRPRKLLYLAIDGVAPRAKINQQRSRRFRAAREAADKLKAAEELREEWNKVGLRVDDDPPPEYPIQDDEKDGADADGTVADEFADRPFDSNVITPGTPFMYRLAVALRKYATKRVATSAAWRNVMVIFSDASVPGEGEHKIAEFIRRERAHPSYNPNLRHVMYGLDADLIMLALATHEVHFTILREEVFPKRGEKRGGGNNAQQFNQPPVRQIDQTLNQNTEKTSALALQSQLGGRKPFFFLHVNVLREYLDQEFRFDIESEIVTANVTAELAYDLERVLDDFVFMCFFVGNDFLPHLPTLDIREGAIEFLIELYKNEIVHTGYLTSTEGDVNFSAVSKLLQRTGEKEDEIFQQRGQRERSQAERYARERQDKRNSHVLKDDPRSSPSGERGSKRRSIDKPAAGTENPKPSILADTIELGGSVAAKIGTAEGRAAAAAALSTSFRRGTSGVKRPSVNDKAINSDAVHRKNEANPRNKAVDRVDNTPTDNNINPKPVVKKSKSEFKEALDERLKAKNELDPVDTIKLGEAGWKARYYEQKFGWDAHHHAEKMMLLRKYIEGLHWVMKYYYVGCISWGWYYPYHFAPFASDLVECDISAADIVLEKGQPFEPFMQLQAVMPASSGKLVLPTCYSDLMSNSNSPIIDYYPEDFQVDLNGKRFAWQGVALLPFIDESRLRTAMDPLKSLLTKDENERNSFGDCHVLSHRDSLFGVARRKRSAADASEMKKIPVEAANGLLFGKSTYPLSEFGGHEDTVITVKFELPPYSPHQSTILPTAVPPNKVLSDMDKADMRRLGWKPAKFGPLGKAAQELAMKRRQRRGDGRGRGRGRGASGGGVHHRGGGGSHGGAYNHKPHAVANGTFEANAMASGMFSNVGAAPPQMAPWASQQQYGYEAPYGQQGQPQHASHYGGQPYGGNGYHRNEQREGAGRGYMQAPSWQNNWQGGQAQPFPPASAGETYAPYHPGRNDGNSTFGAGPAVGGAGGTTGAANGRGRGRRRGLAGPTAASLRHLGRGQPGSGRGGNHPGWNQQNHQRY